MSTEVRKNAHLRAKETQRARKLTILKNQALALASAAEAEFARRAVIDRARQGTADPAAAQACSTCPWRRDNERGESDPWLSDGHLVGYWDQVRSGSAMVCHKTCVLPEVITNEAAEHGWTPTPEHARKRECAGALAQMLKEEQLLDELGSYGAYFAKRGPFGVTPEGFDVLARRRSGEVAPSVRDLTGALEQYERPWFPAPVGDESMPIVPPCSCPVCTRHEEAHDALTLTHPDTDTPVSVDVGIAPVIEALWRSGAVTVASCENLTDALRQLWPAQLPELQRRSLPVQFNYHHTVVHDLAFIRGVDSPAWTPVATAVDALDLGEVMRWGPVIHIAFPLEAAEHLARVS